MGAYAHPSLLVNVMNIDAINYPIVETFVPSSLYEGMPEITNVQYDLWLLQITARFQNVDNPVYITFDGVRGFRVLDEGDLLEFWNPEIRKNGWLWLVKKGGWFDLESFRAGFVSGITNRYDEYLILGENECVSVITDRQPVISTPNP